MLFVFYIERLIYHGCLDAADPWLSATASQILQPIEALFRGIEEKTGIECASKIRSYQGLISDDSRRPCFSGITYVSALNSH